MLREHGQAMTITQIYAQLTTDQSRDALEKMLNRKVNQGVCIRPNKGLYTYAGNPLYTPSLITEEPKKEDVGNVGDVGMSVMSEEKAVEEEMKNGLKSTDIEKEHVGNNSPLAVASQAISQSTDITDIDSGVGCKKSNVGTGKIATKPPIESSHMRPGDEIWIEEIEKHLEVILGTGCAQVNWPYHKRDEVYEPGTIAVNEMARRVRAMQSAGGERDLYTCNAILKLIEKGLTVR